MLYVNKISPLRIKNIQLIILSIVLLAFSSCSAVQKVANVEHAVALEEAQKTFNEAAEKEIEIKSIQPDADNMSMEMAEIMGSYKGVHETVNSLIQDQREALTNDNLLGQAYTLKALTEWKTGKHDQAQATLDEAETTAVSFFPRDKALMAALPFIMKGEEAKQLMTKKQNTFDDVSNQLEQSVRGFNTVISSNSEMDNARLYLLTSQLGVMKNWSDLINDHRKYVTDSPAPTHLRQTLNKWCDPILKDIWNNYSEEVTRINSANACHVYNNFFNAIGPDGCSTITTQKRDCAEL